MVAIGGGLGKWLLSSLQIGYNILFLNGRALYIDSGRLVFISPIWMKFPLREISKVEVVRWKTSRRVQETVRVTPEEGEPRILPPELTRESSAAIVAKFEALR